MNILNFGVNGFSCVKGLCKWGIIYVLIRNIIFFLLGFHGSCWQKTSAK